MSTVKANLRLISATLFASSSPIKKAQILKLTKLSDDEFEAVLKMLSSQLDILGLELVDGPEGYELEVATNLRTAVADMLTNQAQPLSTAALEVLTIVAYEQPIIKADIDQRRGIASDASLRALLARDLIVSIGLKDGSPQYRTTNQFLKVLGLKNISELPPIKKLKSLVNQAEGNPENNNATQNNAS